MIASIADTQGIIAIAAAAVAVVALLACAALATAMRRLRRDQRLLLGDRGEVDVVAHAAAMQEAFEALREYVDETAMRLDDRLAGAEGGLRGTFTHRALVRYAAYNALSGQQSMSSALLDDERSGIVLSCCHPPDQPQVCGNQRRCG